MNIELFQKFLISCNNIPLQLKQNFRSSKEITETLYTVYSNALLVFDNVTEHDVSVFTCM